jgi:hypothetical protein
MNTRNTINGTLDAAELKRLGWPVAWSGTVLPEDREAAEGALRELRDEGLRALETTDGAVGVEIVNGEIVSVVVES